MSLLVELLGYEAQAMSLWFGIQLHHHGNQDDDVWLSMRGTRHNQPCERCQAFTGIYPNGFWQSPRCELCIQRHNMMPYSLYPEVDALLDLYQRPDGNPPTLRLSRRSTQIVASWQEERETDVVENNAANSTQIYSALREHFKKLLPTHDSVCRIFFPHRLRRISRIQAVHS